MNGRYLFDTNIVIAFLTDDAEVTRRLSETDEVYVSSTVVGELFYGASHSTHVDKNVARIEKFLRDAVSLVCDNITARFYGDIKTLLRRKGRPIPGNDIWIASTARQHLLTLVTRDEHFDDVDDLPIVRW